MADVAELPELGEGPPHTVAFEVRWGDRDALGHVNHRVFLFWMEEARVRHMRTLGLADERTRTGVGGILARVEIDYRRPVFYPDTVRATSEVAEVGNTSLIVLQRVYSEQQQALCAQARMVIVVIADATGKPVPVPDEVRQRIAADSSG